MNVNDITSKTQKYVESLLQNPEWFKNAVSRYGVNGTINLGQLSQSINDLEIEIQAQETRRIPKTDK